MSAQTDFWRATCGKAVISGMFQKAAIEKIYNAAIKWSIILQKHNLVMAQIGNI